MLVCMSARITGNLLGRSSPNFLCTLPVAVARSSSDVIPISYVLPVLWLWTCCRLSSFNLLYSLLLRAPGRGTKYCDECVCLSVCLCVCVCRCVCVCISDHISRKKRIAKLHQIAGVTCGRGLMSYALQGFLPVKGFWKSVSIWLSRGKNIVATFSGHVVKYAVSNYILIAFKFLATLMRYGNTPTESCRRSQLAKQFVTRSLIVFKRKSVNWNCHFRAGSSRRYATLLQHRPSCPWTYDVIP